MDPEPTPTDFRVLRAAIVARTPALPRRLAQVGRFVVASPEDVALGNVASVASACGVQPSALVRFAKSFGYAGFIEMQEVLRAHARAGWPDHRARLQALPEDDADPTNLLRGFMAAARESLDRLERLDGTALRRAVGILAGADNLALVASRRAYPLAAYLTYALRHLGLRCDLIDQAGGLAPEQMALLKPSEAVLAISFTPYAPSTLALATAAARGGIPIVALTDSPFSPLAQMADVWLGIAEADHAGFRSLAASFTLVSALAVAVAQQRNGTEVPS